MMKLYYATGTCALASHIALEEAGAEYSTVRINFAAERTAIAGISRHQPQRACSDTGHRQGNID